MNKQDTEKLVAQILADGPMRVLIDANGSAVGNARAARLGIKPAIVMVRNDGWSLGAPRQLALDALSPWFGDWIGFIDVQREQWHAMPKDYGSALKAITEALTPDHRGRGRPTIGDARQSKKTVVLDDWTIEAAKQLGGGNLSAGLRRAVKLAATMDATTAVLPKAAEDSGTAAG